VVDIEGDIWYWYHNISECYYHIQLTVKYRKALLDKEVQEVIVETIKGFKERYAIEPSTIGFDQNHIHVLCRFLPKYSGGQVIRIIKGVTGQQIFERVPSIKSALWGGEFWTDGYYIATISGKGHKEVIERYIRNQGREQDIGQLRLFEV